MLGSGTLRASIGCLLGMVIISFLREAEPFLDRRTNILLIVSAYQILYTLICGLVILTESLDVFGLSGIELGIILVGVNLSVISCVTYWVMARYWAEVRRKHSAYCLFAEYFSC